MLSSVELWILKLNDHMRMVHEKGKCEKCEVVVADKEELNDHICMIHDKGWSVQQDNTEAGDVLSTSGGHHAGKQVFGGLHVKNEDGKMKMFIRRMFNWKNKVRWQNSRPREI